MEKKNILVIFGGCSPEHRVSLQSASGILSHMDREKYRPVPVGISREGRWYLSDASAEDIAEDRWLSPERCAPACLSPDFGGKLFVSRQDGSEAIQVDAAFPVLHGKNGEDGSVQGLLALAGIPVAGCGILASALCMDKDRAHKLAAAAGISVPASFLLEQGFHERDALNKARSLGFPLFVKPLRAGSSFGISRVTEPGAFTDAVYAALLYDTQVLVEKEVPGFEVGCAVMGRHTLMTGEPDEIELSGGFFDFQEKYGLISSKIHVPARVSREKADQIKESAKKIYRALGCAGFARVDMFLTPAGEIIFNEVNTIPGFTPHSRFPAMMGAAGISFTQLIDLAIKEAEAE